MPIYQKMFTLPRLSVGVPAVAGLVITTSACYTFLCWLGDRQIMLKGACNLWKKTVFQPVIHCSGNILELEEAQNKETAAALTISDFFLLCCVFIMYH